MSTTHFTVAVLSTTLLASTPLVPTWLPRQGLLRFYEGYEPRYPYAWWGGQWRHHGPGEGGYCADRGVRSLHGLGDGCYGWPVRVRPYFIASFDANVATPPEEAPAPSDPGAAEPPPQDAPPQPELTWTFAERRAAHAALREFAVEAIRNPSNAQAKAGFAIAAAILDRDAEAAWALRRAAATDLDAIHALVAPGSPGERPVRALATTYAGQPGPEARFATAILHWLLGEDTAAGHHASMAIAEGDTDPVLAAICRPAEAAEALTATSRPLHYRSIENASQ
jgi:hypothetical protein